MKKLSGAAVVLALSLPLFPQAAAPSSAPPSQPAAAGAASPSPAAKPASNELSEAEQKDLSRALSEAGTSSVDFIRALERHMEKYPNSPQKDQFELALAKASIDAHDNARILLYGQRVLDRDPDNAVILERTTRVLLNSDDKESSEKALKYAKHMEDLLLKIEKSGVPEGRSHAQLLEDLDRGVGRALVFEARATGNLGHYDEAIALAHRSFDRFPSAESAREIGRWLAKSGKDMEAVAYYADAFTIADRISTDLERAKDRAKMAELYRKDKQTEVGLGDMVLAAYDRMQLVMQRRAAAQQQLDPNANLSNILDFTLTGLGGEKLPLATLKGKVVVLDFWATWCGPCRAQYPLYQQVKHRFASNPNVVFLGINTDDDRSMVKPFIEESKWDKSVYYEDGLQTLLQVNSIPATIVVDPQGQISSRMNGFLPDRFVQMLSDRITEALGKKPLEIPRSGASAVAPTGGN